MNSMRVTILALVIVACFVVFQTAEARTITVLGGRSCQDWIAARSHRNEVAGGFDWVSSATSEAWLLGLVNGINSMSNTQKDILYSADADLIYAWMDGYCKENMGSSVYEGANKLVHKLEINTEKRKEKNR